MPLQELSPTRGWPSTVSRIHILRDCPSGNRKPQSCQFGLDSLLTPQPIFGSHPSDERPKLLGNRVATVPPSSLMWPPRPISTPAPAMSPQHGLWFHDEERMRQPPNQRLTQIQNRRSALLRRGCGHLRCSTNSCCRRLRFSAISSALGLKAAAIVQSRKRTTRPLRPIPVVAEGQGPRLSTTKLVDGDFAPHR